MVSTERTLGKRYRLERRLAAGAMGVVYEAEDTTLHRRVAVKLLNEALSEDERFIERFRREARSSAALSHPNIASVFDYGQDGGCHYIVMELVEGKDLAALLRDEAPLSIERITRIASQTANALGHAHAADLVHRDVKPANVLVANGDKVKVTDFGIARAGGDSTLTAIGSVLGTAHYISPEQAAGQPATPRSDVYSLGIVLYEMLTGSVPFTGESMVAIASRHAAETVPTPSDARPEVPPGLDTIVATATARDPRDRYADGAAMASALYGEVWTPAATVPLPTSSLGADAMRELPSGPVPLPTDRWNAQKVGRAVVVIAVLLLLLSVGGGLARLMSRDDPAPVAKPEATVTAGPAGPDVPIGLVGLSYKEAERSLRAVGFEVTRTEDEGSTEPKDTVVRVDPEEGSTASEGDTITLFVSQGRPGSTPVGKEHGKGKDHEKGKGKRH